MILPSLCPIIFIIPWHINSLTLIITHAEWKNQNSSKPQVMAGSNCLFTPPIASQVINRQIER